MNKKIFLKQIEANLKVFESSEVKEIISYYEEIIADKMESGLTEEEAVNSLGDVEQITNEIKATIVMKRSEQKTTNSLRNFLIILGICSTPILLPIGITFTALYFTLYLVLLLIVLSFSVSGFGVIIGVIVESTRTIISGGALATILIQLGAGFVVGALLMFVAIGTAKITKVLLNRTNKFFIRMIRKRSKKGIETDV